MAWLQNLAGKAEDLLNKIDKNAANVLNESAVNNSKFDEENVINIIEPSEIPFEKENTYSSLVIIDETDYPTNKNQIEIEPLILENVDHEVSHDTPGRCSSTSSNDKFKMFERVGKSESTVLSSSESCNFIEERIRYEEQISKLNTENQDLNKQVLNMQHIYLELKNDYSNLQADADLTKDICKQAHTEMEQYKIRAQRILHEKEKVSQISHQVSNESDDQLLYLTNCNNNLRKEIQLHQDENKDLKNKINNLTQELNALQQQTIFIRTNNQQSSKGLQESILQERALRVSAEEDLRSKTNELQITKFDLNKFQNLLNTKDTEIEKLSNHLKSQSNVNTDNSDERFYTLTNTLMMKQDRLETLTTERNALKIQLEKLEDSFKRLSNQKQQVPLKNVSKINEADDVPRLLHVSPMDVGMTRKVKQTYSTLDTLSIRTGVFLRRYPLARIFVFCYIVLLHIWVLLILFTYVPSTR